MAVIPLAWFSGLEASCLRPKEEMRDFMCCETRRWAANREDRGDDRIWVREVCRAWISCGEGVAKYEGFLAS